MSCKFIVKKLDKSVYCKKRKCRINFEDCKSCNDRQYQTYMKNATPRLIEKQNKRFSIIYHNLNFCAVCDLKHVKKQHVDLNEVYEGAKRQASMTYGFVIPLCRQCHNRFHTDRDFALHYKKLFQQEFEKQHSRQEFLNIIHKSYI